MHTLEEFYDKQPASTEATDATKISTKNANEVNDNDENTSIKNEKKHDEATSCGAVETNENEVTNEQSKRSHARKAVTKDLVMTAMFCALCIVLPLAFHAIPQGGMLFSPMHIPVLLAGMICGWQYGLAVGLIGPTLSALITGMPPMATLPSMLFECAAYGAISGLLMKFVRTGHTYADMYISLAAAMLAGRIVGGASKALFFSNGEYAFATWVTAYFVKALPGIILHLALIPNVVYGLMKARIIDMRYPTKTK